MQPFAPGTRVQAHPATDAWMQGDRFGTVIGSGRKPGPHPRPVLVKMDRSGRTRRFHPDNLTPVEG